jgi:ADP-heptose:LPS heptosyltransferase
MLHDARWQTTCGGNAGANGFTMRILVVRTDRLGDSLLTLPAVADLRQARPDAHIAFWCRPGIAPLIAWDRHLDAVHSWDPADDHSLRALQAEGFDAALCCHGRPELAKLLWRAGIRQRVGNGRRWFSLLFSHRLRASRSRRRLHESDSNRALAQLLLGPGFQPGPARNGLLVPQQELTAADTLLAQVERPQPVVLQPGSLGSSEDWPPERMAELGRQLEADGVPVLVHLGPPEAKRLGHLFTDFPVVGADLSLPGLAAVCSRARCLVGNSTGPLHLAAALGRPVVGLYPTTPSMAPARWGPIGAPRRVLTAKPGAMASIPVAAVAAAVTELLAEAGPS